jgi:GDPmannose 4,6-dehydratase
MDLADMSSIIEALNVSTPHEVYHLAAQSFVGASFEQPLSTGDITALGTTRMLEAIRLVSKDTAFYQASTSELYGNSPSHLKNETSAFEPRSPYAVAKLYAYWATRVYRDGYGLFACNGILFNHESPLRGLEFVTRKISNACAKISLGLQDTISIGNLEASRDWGHAEDYVGPMWMMLQQDKPDDFVIATGDTHSVQEFVNAAFAHAGLDSSTHLKLEKRLMRPLEVTSLAGDSTKARQRLGWTHKKTFDDLVKDMVESDLERWKANQKGDVFPWDAPLYPNDRNIIITRYALDR